MFFYPGATLDLTYSFCCIKEAQILILNIGLDRFSSQKITYRGKASDRFTTFEISKESNTATYLNLELIEVDEGRALILTRNLT